MKEPAKELKRYEVVIQRLMPALLLNGWNCTLRREPVPGDVVMLQSAPMSVWHLSIYRKDCHDGYHLLESVKTGEMMRWGNVGFHVIDREKAWGLERIEWTDDQFEFSSKFNKVIRRREMDFYINIPYISEWDGDNVLIKFRTRYNFDELVTPLDPIPWRKITQKALLEHLTAGAAEHVANRNLLQKESA